MRAVKLCERGVKDPLGRLVLPRTGAEIAIDMSYRLGPRAVPAPYALPAGIGWLTVIGFSRPPYAQLRPAGPAAVHAAVVVGVSALAGAGFGLVFRWYWRRLTLVSMGRNTGMRHGASPGSPEGASDAASGAAIGVRRRLAGVALAAVLLPLL